MRANGRVYSPGAATRRVDSIAMHNVDPAEIEKFESIASRWWDPSSEFKPLHDINPARLDYIERSIGECGAVLDGRKVLDVGCGGGILAESMARAGAVVTGIDMGETPLAVARLHATQAGVDVDYQRIAASDLAATRAGDFEVVTCMEVLEHVPDPAALVASCARLTALGGHVFFSTINRSARAWLAAIVGAEYVLNLLPRGTHRYRNFIRPSELSRWCRAADLEVRRVTGLHYNPLTRDCRIGPGVAVNYIVHCIAHRRGAAGK